MTVEEVEESLEALFRLGLLTRDSEGTVRAHRRRLATLRAFRGDEMFAYHHNFMRLAQEALSKVTHKVRYFGGATIAIPMARIQDFKAEAALFVERMANLADSNDSSEPQVLYQFNAQLFPLAQIPSRQTEVEKPMLTRTDDSSD